MSGALSPATIGLERWPQGVPVQVHYATGDPEVDPTEIGALVDAARAANAEVDVYTYPVAGHLFADPDLPEYDRASADLMLERALAFLRRHAPARG